MVIRNVGPAFSFVLAVLLSVSSVSAADSVISTQPDSSLPVLSANTATTPVNKMVSVTANVTSAQTIVKDATLANGSVDVDKIAAALNKANSATKVNEVFTEILKMEGDKRANFYTIGEITELLSYSLISSALSASKDMQAGLSVSGAMYNGLGNKIEAECSKNGSLDTAAVAKKLKSWNNATLSAQVLFGLSYTASGGSQLAGPSETQLNNLVTAICPSLTKNNLDGRTIDSLSKITSYNKALQVSMLANASGVDAVQVAGTLTKLNSAQTVVDVFTAILNKSGDRRANFYTISEITAKLDDSLIQSSLLKSNDMQAGLSVTGAMYNGLGNKVEKECSKNGKLDYSLLSKRLQSRSAYMGAAILLGLSYTTQPGSQLAAPSASVLTTTYNKVKNSLKQNGLGTKIIAKLAEMVKYDDALSDAVAKLK